MNLNLNFNLNLPQNNKLFVIKHYISRLNSDNSKNEPLLNNKYLKLKNVLRLNNSEREINNPKSCIFRYFQKWVSFILNIKVQIIQKKKKYANFKEKNELLNPRICDKVNCFKSRKSRSSINKTLNLKNKNQLSFKKTKSF